MIALVNSYAAVFPDESPAIYRVFLQTTRGATVSQELADAFERAAADGNRGDISAFRSSSRAAFSLLKSTIDRVARGELPVDSNLGPQLWLLNADFKIAPAIWIAVRAGFGDDDASAQTVAAFSVSVAPLGHAVAIQKAPTTHITNAARRPCTPAAIRFVFGS